MELCQERRGVYRALEYTAPNRALIRYDLPLSEILMDFFDQLKSRTKGYASFDYDFKGYEESSLVKLDICLNGDPVDALSFITHRERAYPRGKALVERLKSILPRQQFEIRIQASIGNKVIAAERISALRKNVIAMLWRRHLAQAQATREADRRQEAHEADRQRRSAPGGFHERAPRRRGVDAQSAMPGPGAGAVLR